MLLRVLALIVSLTFAIPVIASAHETGVSLNQTVGAYVIDMGYNPMPVQGRRFVLDFKLWEAAATTTPAQFDSVHVTVRQKDSIVAATDIVQSPIGTVLIFTPPAAADMSIEAAYERGD